MLRPSHLLAIASLALSALPLGSAAQPSPYAALLEAPADDAPAFELMQKSRVAFWRGMSRQEFESRTLAKSATERVLRLGEFEFTVAQAEFYEQAGLVAASVEFRDDDPQRIEAAFEAYKRALGGIKPDYTHSAPRGTPDIPDLRFEMLGWKSADGAESALARLHSFAGKARNKDAPAAGRVTFALRRR